MSTELKIAEEDLTCDRCNGVIPNGHKYWSSNFQSFQRGGLRPTEHTNCENYGVNDTRRKCNDY